MTIERVDPATLDLETAQRLAAVLNAYREAHTPRLPPANARTLLGLARHTFGNRPFDAMWIAHDSTGRPVGQASLELSEWDNPRLAMVFCTVHPEASGQGFGTALLQAQIDAAREAGCTTLKTYCLRDRPSERFLLAQGFERAQRTAMRRLEPASLDYEVVETMVNEAQQLADDYELVFLDGPAPPDWLPRLAALFEAINDAPTDDLDFEPEAYPLERLQRYEQAMLARQQHLYRLMARHRVTGDWAGHTILVVDEHRPGIGIQEDTTVVPGHRGHRLGLLLKASMLLWMRTERPELALIDTWNAESNAHMIAVNERLGCELVYEGSALQLRLPRQIG